MAHHCSKLASQFLVVHNKFEPALVVYFTQAYGGIVHNF